MHILNILKSGARRATFIGLMGAAIACNVEDLNKFLPATSLSGSVGDGPVTEAQVSAIDAKGAIVGATVSSTTANYNIEVSADSTYPIILNATGGTDLVTGAKPDFTMVSAASDSSVETVNINPFSTLIVKTAQAMAGGLTPINLSKAKQYILEQLNFGLDPALVSNPITTEIDETNVAAIVKASEAMGETIRRTRSAMLAAGFDLTENAVIDIVAADMVDGVLDGLGNASADATVAATFNVVSAQVLVESLVNRLNVGGADATILMDTAISLTTPTATMTTSNVVITNGMLTQAKTAVASAQAFSSNSNIAAVAVALAALSGNTLAANVETVLPADSSAAFNEIITQVPLATDQQLEAINTVVRTGNTNIDGGTTNTGGDSGGNTGGNTGGDTGGGVVTPMPGSFEFSASAYSVQEADEAVNITINRVGGSDGETTVQWRTITFDQYGTADWANDYGTFLWDERPITFSDGETSKVEQIAINQDSLVEGDETFTILLRIASDSVGNLGNISTATVTIKDDDITPVDNAPPVITLLGSNPVTVAMGGIYVDAGANAMDDIDGDISSAINVDSSSVNTAVAGNYSVVYRVSDYSGNAATPVTRTVNVVNATSARPWEDLLNNMIGFAAAAGTTGGKGGDVCHVTNLNDSGTGSLRSCAQSNGAKWIVFDVSGTINLSSNLNIQSNKTIDGRGADITLTNSGPWIDNGVENIVIHNIKVVGTWDDNIHLNNNVKKIWIDHVYMATPGDESIGISTSNSTSQSPRDITVSWCKFDKSGFGALVGGSPSYTNNVDITLTMHHNFYNAVRERAPRMSYGKAHLYNNYIYNWAWTGAVSTQTAQVASENNIYEDGSNTMDHRGLLADADGGTAAGYIRSSGDLFLGTATSKIAGSDKVFDPQSYYSYSIDTADSSLKTRVMNGAGWQNVPKPL